MSDNEPEPPNCEKVANALIASNLNPKTLLEPKPLCAWTPLGIFRLGGDAVVQDPVASERVYKQVFLIYRNDIERSEFAACLPTCLQLNTYIYIYILLYNYIYVYIYIFWEMTGAFARVYCTGHKALGSVGLGLT